MDTEQMRARALEIARMYRERNEADGHVSWDVSAYTAGFLGDAGDLSKLVMAHAGYRDMQGSIRHELGDCLYSLLVIADCLHVDLWQAFTETMDELEERINDEIREP